MSPSPVRSRISLWDEGSWPPSPHDPRERETALLLEGWEVRVFTGRWFQYFVTHGLWHLQLWSPAGRVSILTPSRLTRGLYEAFPVSNWKTSAPTYDWLATLITGLGPTHLLAAAQVLAHAVRARRRGTVARVQVHISLSGRAVSLHRRLRLAQEAARPLFVPARVEWNRLPTTSIFNGWPSISTSTSKPRGGSLLSSTKRTSSRSTASYEFSQPPRPFILMELCAGTRSATSWGNTTRSLSLTCAPSNK